MNRTQLAIKKIEKYYYEQKINLLLPLSEEIKLLKDAADKTVREDVYNVHHLSHKYCTGICPSCGKKIKGFTYETNYCKHCGQALEWNNDYAVIHISIEKEEQE